MVILLITTDNHCSVCNYNCQFFESLFNSFELHMTHDLLKNLKPSVLPPTMPVTNVDRVTKANYNRHWCNSSYNTKF